MTMTPLADEAALEPPPPECCDLEAHLPPIEFPTALDPALRVGRPDTIHIHRRRAS